MAKILLVEDSNAFGVIMSQKIEEELPHQVIWKKDYASTKDLLDNPDTDFFIAILDLRLPDAYDGEIVDLVLEKNIPVIVVTTELNDDLRERFFSKPIVDYILKNNIQCFTLVINTIQRIAKNPSTKIMVVDDSKTSRMAICNLLEIHKYSILQADNGKVALQCLAQNPDIKVVITDYTMPEMNGIELTNALRRGYKKEEMAIMGLSAFGNTLLSAKFIKNGANDFITKPFSPEEFYWRLTHLIETLEYIDQIRDASIRDFLTGLYNRRFFFDKGEQILQEIHEGRQHVAVTMIDIDHFKNVNDTYGHDAGDRVIQFLSSKLIDPRAPLNLAARFGGEEFCLLHPGLDPKSTYDWVESLRQVIEESIVLASDDQPIKFSISAGICAQDDLELEQMIQQADRELYEAKEQGRNKVCIDMDLNVDTD